MISFLAILAFLTSDTSEDDSAYDQWIRQEGERLTKAREAEALAYYVTLERNRLLSEQNKMDQLRAWFEQRLEQQALARVANQESLQIWHAQQTELYRQHFQKESLSVIMSAVTGIQATYGVAQTSAPRKPEPQRQVPPQPLAPTPGICARPADRIPPTQQETHLREQADQNRGYSR